VIANGPNGQHRVAVGVGLQTDADFALHISFCHEHALQWLDTFDNALSLLIRAAEDENIVEQDGKASTRRVVHLFVVPLEELALCLFYKASVRSY
jgi:hypothetical protein